MGKYLTVAKQTWTEFGEDKAPRLGAALAYYTIFSIGPLLLIAVAMAGIFLGEEAAQGKVSAELGKVFGPKMAEAMETMITAAAKPKSGTVATILGVIMLFVGASGVFAQLKDAMNTIWNVEPKKSEGFKGLVKDRFLSMAMVLGIGFLLLISLVLDAVISAMGPLLERLIGGATIVHVVQLVISFGVATVLFAAIYKFLPDLKIAWKDVWVGAVATALLFAVGKWALGLYLGKAAVGSAYGAAGSLVILLVWVYWSAQILFFGAEFTQVYARTWGSLKGDTSKRDARAGAKRIEDAPTPKGDEITSGGTPSVQQAHARPARPPVPAPMYGKPKSSGGLVKLAAGGVAGLIFGVLIGGVSTIGFVLKTVRKVFLPKV